jgi:hypothetical protein
MYEKTMQFLFAMSIILEGNSSFAGTNKTTPVDDKPTLSTSSVTPIRGPQVMIITVLDDEFEPVSGATISAPCTGSRAVTTNWTGTAIFPVRAGCHCNGASATVTTPKGDVEHVALKPTGDNVVFVRH